MALFGKKKLTLDEILAGIDNLSDEEKAQIHAKMQDLYKAEDEREIDKIEEEKADSDEIAEDKGEDVKEESEEIGKDVDQVEEEVKEDESEEASTETDMADVKEEGEKSTTEELEEENLREVIHGLTDRISQIEESLASFEELKAKMDEYVRKNDDAFGYAGSRAEGKKDYSEMSADELKKEILGNQR